MVTNFTVTISQKHFSRHMRSFSSKRTHFTRLTVWTRVSQGLETHRISKNGKEHLSIMFYDCQRPSIKRLQGDPLYRAPASLESQILDCLQNDTKQCCDITKLIYTHCSSRKPPIVCITSCDLNSGYQQVYVSEDETLLEVILKANSKISSDSPPPCHPKKGKWCLDKGECLGCY